MTSKKRSIIIYVTSYRYPERGHNERAERGKKAVDKELIEMMKIISEDMQRRRDNDLKKIGLTFSQVRVLLMVFWQSGEITQKEIEDKLYVSHSATHGIIARLEDKGYIRSDFDKNDKRNKVLYVTETGRERIEFLDNMRAQKPNPMDSLNLQDKEDLKRILAKIIAEIK